MEGKSVEENYAQPTEITSAFMRIVKQNRKEWTEAGVKASRHTDVSRNLATVVIRGVLPGLRRRRTGLLPSGPKSSFQMRASFVFHLETKVLESGGRVEKLIVEEGSSCLKSSVKFSQSVMIWGAMSSAGVGPLCFFENQRHCTRLPIHFGALHASFCWPAFQRCWFHFPAGFGTCPYCQKHQKLVKWPWCWCAWLASKLTRPEPQRIYRVLSRVKWETRDQKCRWAEGHHVLNISYSP